MQLIASEIDEMVPGAFVPTRLLKAGKVVAAHVELRVARHVVRDEVDHPRDRRHPDIVDQHDAPDVQD
jgi:hypothetical protein